MGNKIITLACICFLTCCKSLYKEQSQKLQNVIQVLDSKKVSNQAKAILVIPNVGCIGCINNAEDFIVKNINKTENLVVIFTNFQYKKILKMKLGNAIYYHSNILLDDKNEVYRQGLFSQYPVIYYLRSNQIIDIQEARPDNPKNVFQELLTKLKV